MFVDDFLDVDIADNVGVSEHDVFQLLLRHHVAFQRVNRFHLSFVNVAKGVERKRREQRKSAVFAVKVPVASHAKVVHKAVVVVARDDTDRADAAVDKV